MSTPHPSSIRRRSRRGRRGSAGATHGGGRCCPTLRGRAAGSRGSRSTAPGSSGWMPGTPATRGRWHLADAAPAGWTPVTVPHTWQIDPASAEYYGRGVVSAPVRCAARMARPLRARRVPGRVPLRAGVGQRASRRRAPPQGLHRLHNRPHVRAAMGRRAGRPGRAGREHLRRRDAAARPVQRLDPRRRHLPAGDAHRVAPRLHRTRGHRRGSHDGGGVAGHRRPPRRGDRPQHDESLRPRLHRLRRPRSQLRRSGAAAAARRQGQHRARANR